MSEFKLVIPGWRASIINSGLKSYPVEFQYTYSLELFRKYIYNGDYSSSSPFGISKEEDSFYIVSKELVSRLNIHNNPATCSSDSLSISSSDWYDTYIITSVHSILEREGYVLPFKNRSLVGKAKQAISNLEKPVRTLDIDHKGNQLRISCYESEWFEVLRNGSEILILHHPKHEFREDRFGLMDPELVDFLVKEKWSDSKRTTSFVQSRYMKLDAILKEGCVEHGIIIERFDEFPTLQLKRPSLTFPNGMRIDLELETSEYSDIITKNIDLSEGPDSVTVIVDETKQKNLSKDEDILEFKEWFRTRINRDVTELPVGEIDPINDIESDAAIIIVDDEYPGAGYVYDAIKNQVTIPSKVIRLKTVRENKGRYDDLTWLSWMALRFRMTQKLHHVLSSNLEYTPIGLSITSHMGGEFLALVGASIVGNSIESRVSLLEQDYTKDVPDYDAVEEILQILTRKSENTPLILFSDTISLQPLLESYCDNHEALAVNVRQVSGTILQFKSSEYFIPPSGSFVGLSKEVYLVQTDGRPDFEGDGIPRSILVHPVAGTVNDIESLLEYIYALTFIHPASLVKPKLPIPLHLVSSLPSAIRRHLEESIVLEGFLQ